MADTVKWGAILFKAQAVLREVGSSGETSASFTTVSSVGWPGGWMKKLKRDQFPLGRSFSARRA